MGQQINLDALKWPAQHRSECVCRYCRDAHKALPALIAEIETLRKIVGLRTDDEVLHAPTDPRITELRGLVERLSRCVNLHCAGIGCDASVDTDRALAICDSLAVRDDLANLSSRITSLLPRSILTDKEKLELFDAQRWRIAELTAMVEQLTAERDAYVAQLRDVEQARNQR